MSDRRQRKGKGPLIRSMGKTKHPHKGRSGSKRNRSSYEEAGPQRLHQGAEDAVDDMLVASTFAHLTAFSPTDHQHQQGKKNATESTGGSSSSEDDSSASTDSEDDDDEEDDDNDNENADVVQGSVNVVKPTLQMVEDENEIPINDEENEASVPLSSGEKEKKEKKEDDDDDYEVEFLAEALAQMQENEDDDDADEDLGKKGRKKKSASTAATATTEHELDSYRTPLVELESKFAWQVSVPPEEEVAIQTKRTSPAGRVKYHMMAERTIVVESLLDHFSRDKNSAPLEEGTLLLIQTAPDSWAPVGKVFEVFGPVSRPLYTIRLPPPPQQQQPPRSSSSTSSTKRKSPHRKHQNDRRQDCGIADSTRQVQQATGDSTQMSNGPPSSDHPNKDSVSLDRNEEKAKELVATTESRVASPSLEERVSIDDQLKTKEEKTTSTGQELNPDEIAENSKPLESKAKNLEREKDSAETANSGVHENERELVPSTETLDGPVEPPVIAPRDEEVKEKQHTEAEQGAKGNDEVSMDEQVKQTQHTEAEQGAKGNDEGSTDEQVKQTQHNDAKQWAQRKDEVSIDEQIKVSQHSDAEQGPTGKDEVAIATPTIEGARVERESGSKSSMDKTKSIEELGTATAVAERDQEVEETRTTEAGDKRSEKTTTPIAERDQEAEETWTAEVATEESEMKQEIAEGAKQEEPDDPWSPKGRYTQLLRSQPSLLLFFVPEEAKMIDTAAVVRASGRGCDASNLYDEEVVNVNEMEFSDDEEERNAKRRGSKRGHDKKGSHIEDAPRQSRPSPRSDHSHAGYPPPARTNAVPPLHSYHHHPKAYVPPPPTFSAAAPHGQPPHHLYPTGYSQTTPQGAARMSQAAGTMYENVAAYPQQHIPAGVHSYQQQYPYPSAYSYAVPPPAPPQQNPAFPGGLWYQQQQQANTVSLPQTQTQNEESDTVYYDYS